MNKFLMIAVALSAFLLPAQAQEELQRVEVFAGYQFSHFDPSLNASGWNAAINGNVSRWLGITGDFSGTYKNGGHLYSFMGGADFLSPNQAGDAVCPPAAGRRHGLRKLRQRFHHGIGRGIGR
jgi:opacity protein-like surface antigen